MELKLGNEKIIGDGPWSFDLNEYNFCTGFHKDLKIGLKVDVDGKEYRIKKVSTETGLGEIYLKLVKTRG